MFGLLEMANDMMRISAGIDKEEGQNVCNDSYWASYKAKHLNRKRSAFSPRLEFFMEKISTLQAAPFVPPVRCWKIKVLCIWSVLISAVIIETAIYSWASTSVARAHNSFTGAEGQIIFAAMAFSISIVCLCLFAMWQLASKMEMRVQSLLAELNSTHSQIESLENSKTSLLSNVSHFLRTPLKGIIGTISLFEESGPLTPSQRDCVDVALKSCWSLADHVSNTFYGEMGLVTSYDRRDSESDLNIEPCAAETQATVPDKTTGGLQPEVAYNSQDEWNGDDQSWKCSPVDRTRDRGMGKVGCVGEDPLLADALEGKKNQADFDPLLVHSREKPEVCWKFLAEKLKPGGLGILLAERSGKATGSRMGLTLPG